MLPQHLSILVLREDGGFVGYCPELSLSTDRQDTEEEAHRILREGIALMFEVSEMDDAKPARRRSAKQTRRSAAAATRKAAAPSAPNSAPKKSGWLM